VTGSHVLRSTTFDKERASLADSGGHRDFSLLLPAAVTYFDRPMVAWLGEPIARHDEQPLRPAVGGSPSTPGRRGQRADRRSPDSVDRAQQHRRSGPSRTHRDSTRRVTSAPSARYPHGQRLLVDARRRATRGRRGRRRLFALADASASDAVDSLLGRGRVVHA
jgi:hypothetical protein